MTETTNDLNPPAERRLERSSSDRMVAGVAGGLARYFDIHPAVYRVGFVVLTLLGGAGLVIYLAAALVMPVEGEEDSYATRALRERRDRPMPIIGLGLLLIAMVSLLGHASVWPHDSTWIGLVLVGGAIVFFTREGAGKHPILKALLVALAALFTLAAVAVAIFVTTFHVDPGRGVGNHTYVVTKHSTLDSSYRLGIGKLVLDLRNVRFADGTTNLNARVDVGDLRIFVPPTTRVELDASAQAGKVEALGFADDGRHAHVSVAPEGEPQLVLHAHVGAGRVQIVRASTR
jgi:phage shock protein PspC (stress-responsive transcriptional regulator)